MSKETAEEQMTPEQQIANTLKNHCFARGIEESVGKDGEEIWIMNPELVGKIIDEELPIMLKEYAQQSQVTDEQIEEKLNCLYNDLQKNAYSSDYHNYFYKETNQAIRKHFEAFAKWMRDLQPKTDDWISVDERLPMKKDANVKGEILASTDVGSTILLSWKYAGQKNAGRFRFPFWQPLPQPPNTQNREL